jgi:hypothetical protein
MINKRVLFDPFKTDKRTKTIFNSLRLFENFLYITRHLPPSSSSISGLSSSSFSSVIELFCWWCSVVEVDLPLSFSCWLLPKLFVLLLIVTDFFSSVLFLRSIALYALTELPLVFILASINFCETSTSKV